jgi:hypothetical protein
MVAVECLSWYPNRRGFNVVERLHDLIIRNDDSRRGSVSLWNRWKEESFNWIFQSANEFVQLRIIRAYYPLHS